VGVACQKLVQGLVRVIIESRRSSEASCKNDFRWRV